MKYALLLCLLLTPRLLGQIEDPSAPWAGGAPAEIDLWPEGNGDVQIDIENSTVPPAAIGLIARSRMRCKWEPNEDLTGSNAVWGVCRKWLHADATYMQGSIDVAPIVAALRAAGAPEVRIKLWAWGLNVSAAPKGWRKQTISSKRIVTGQKDYYTYTASSGGRSSAPPPFPVSAGERCEASRLAAPLVFLSIGPAILAFWLRRRARRQGTLNASAAG